MWDNVKPWWAGPDDDIEDADDTPVRLESHIIVSGDDALAMTIVEELNKAGVSIVELSAGSGHRASAATVG